MQLCPSSVIFYVGLMTCCDSIQENDSTKDQRKSMYMLLWDRATQPFTSKDYKACEDFCTAALGYAEADAEAAVARQLALAHLAQRYPDRSAEPTWSNAGGSWVLAADTGARPHMKGII